MTVFAALALAASCLISLASPAGAAPRAAYAFGSVIESLPRYQGQSTCSPSAKRGTAALSTMLLSTYRTTRSLGIVRACGIGGMSEHKEGRAFDWGVSAYNATHRANVTDFTNWALATDRYGNKFANARRLGIQYMIWNRRIWSATYASSGWRQYSGPSPHTDHVHISLSWNGANKKTSFWTGKVGSTSAVRKAAPKPKPAPKPTPPKVAAASPLQPPVKPAKPLSGPTLNDESVYMAATSTTGATTKGAVQKGQKYLVEMSGTFRYAKAAGAVADAECSAAPGSGQWRRNRSVHASQPTAKHLDLYLNGRDVDGASDAAVAGTSLCDTSAHTYRRVYTADQTGRLNLRVWDPTGQSDNAGGLWVRFIRYTAKSDMTWSVPAKSSVGVSSPGVVEVGATYVASVTGAWGVGKGYTADAECATGPGDDTWRRYRSTVASQPTADQLDVLFDKRDVSGNALVRRFPRENCDSLTHTYQYTFKAAATRMINVRAGDPGGHADNTGAFTVRVRKVVPVTGAETVKVDTSRVAGAATARVYPAGKPVLLRVTGTYDFGAGYRADAECTRTEADRRWNRTRAELVSDDSQPLGDVTVNGLASNWSARRSVGGCDVNNTYTLRYTPSQAGVIHVGVADDNHADNVGVLNLTVEQTK